MEIAGLLHTNGTFIGGFDDFDELPNWVADVLSRSNTRVYLNRHVTNRGVGLPVPRGTRYTFADNGDGDYFRFYRCTYGLSITGKQEDLVSKPFVSEEFVGAVVAWHFRHNAQIHGNLQTPKFGSHFPYIFPGVPNQNNVATIQTAYLIGRASKIYTTLVLRSRHVAVQRLSDAVDPQNLANYSDLYSDPTSVGVSTAIEDQWLRDEWVRLFPGWLDGEPAAVAYPVL